MHKQTHNSDTQEPIQVKLFTIITDKVITMIKIRCGRALDELTGSNKGKIRLLSRAKEKKYSKGKRNGSRYRAERVVIIHEMTTERKQETPKWTYN